MRSVRNPGPIVSTAVPSLHQYASKYGGYVKRACVRLKLHAFSSYKAYGGQSRHSKQPEANPAALPSISLISGRIWRSQHR